MVAAPFGDDLSTPTMQMLQFPELAASKLVALARRQLARNLFDAALVADSAAPDLDIVRTVPGDAGRCVGGRRASPRPGP